MGCFTSSAQGTLLSTKSYEVLHTKGPTDSLSRVLVISKSSEYFGKQEKHKLKYRKPKKRPHTAMNKLQSLKGYKKRLGIWQPGFRSCRYPLPASLRERDAPLHLKYHHSKTLHIHSPEKPQQQLPQTSFHQQEQSGACRCIFGPCVVKLVPAQELRNPSPFSYIILLTGEGGETLRKQQQIVKGVSMSRSLESQGFLRSLLVTLWRSSVALNSLRIFITAFPPSNYTSGPLLFLTFMPNVTLCSAQPHLTCAACRVYSSGWG